VTLQAGTRLGPYEIVAAIGAGGMGEVYRARDTRLDRDVAIKVLPAEFASDPERLRRFEQEARAVAALDHPNILALYDVGTHEGLPYLVTQLLEGESLRDRLSGRVLPVRKAVETAVQIAQGLAAAHERGIVHRDVKPGNVFITKDGHVKVLDFGIAKVAIPQPSGAPGGAPTVVEATEAGTTLGTVGYMSPEQLRGQPVDHRTDIFSFGCVLYEMLSGQRAFAGETAADTITEVLSKDPAPLGGAGGGVSPALQGIVGRCLEKRPDDRFSSAHDLALALNAVTEALLSGQAHPKPSEKSIVVLPFENLSPDPENAFFADGLTEELIADLSKVRTLRVISRTSAMLLKGSKRDVPTIARDLNVRYVLEGSVRRAGTSLRITAQLIDAGNDAHLWAEKYSGTLDDVFAIQEKVSGAIVESLKLQLTPQEAERLAVHPVPNALAYELYLRAKQEILKYTEAGLDNALSCLKSGLEIAGPNAALYAGMAAAHVQFANLGLRADEECRKEAEEFLRRALEIDPGCAQAHLVSALIVTFDNPREGIKSLKRVLETDPDNFDALFYLTCVLGTLGQTRAVLPLEERTIRIDPLNPAAHFHSGFNRMWEGKFALASDVLQRLHHSFPEDMLIKFSYGLSLAYANERERAVPILEEVVREQPGTHFAALALALGFGLQGKSSEALSCLDSNPRLQKSRDFQYSCWVAECYALAGAREKALDWVERSVSFGMINYPFLGEYDPFLAILRNEPQFQRLMARVKSEWERLEV
jgi:serine/threonine protein kinase/tetratricopeptide (TPR) repeat protein